MHGVVHGILDLYSTFRGMEMDTLSGETFKTVFASLLERGLI